MVSKDHKLSLSAGKKVLKELEDIAADAGRILIRFKRKKSLSVHGKASQGVASEADLASEKFIIKKLKKLEKDFQLNASMLAEENAFETFGESSLYANLGEKEYCWSIDPLDGTNNYLTGLDYYAISIALLYQGLPIIAVVFRPERDECFCALKGLGASRKQLYAQKTRSKKLTTLLSEARKEPPKKISQAILATGFAAEKGIPFDREFETFRRVMENSRAVRRMGSAALDICYLAQGVFDGFWERGLAPWDTAGASLICQEAGVKVTDYSGQNFSPFGETILAGRSPLYQQLKKIVHP